MRMRLTIVRLGLDVCEEAVSCHAQPATPFAMLSACRSTTRVRALYCLVEDVAYGRAGPGFQSVSSRTLGCRAHLARRNINQAQPGGFCESVLTGVDAFYSTRYTSFEPYLQLNKTAFIAEGGAAYHVDVPGGDSMVDVQRGYWSDCITNTTLHDLFPTLHSHISFEHIKVEFECVRIRLGVWRQD